MSATTLSSLRDYAQGALAEREAFYRTVLESLAEAVIITDAEWRVCYANRMVVELTGYPLEELLGTTVHDLLKPLAHSTSQCRAQDPLSPRPESVQLEMLRKDGQLHWMHLQAVPFRNTQGEIIGRVAAFSCIERQKNLEAENELLQDELRPRFDSLVGQSPVLQKVMSQIATVAPTEANVLVLGESGTGKELVARAIHEHSPRKERSLVRVNCASIPKDLFESEFFGHVRGAFTGAIKDRLGRFELADGGTLFLDEVGEIPLDLQSKLLRVLQEGQFERLGDDRTRTVKVRIVAATNRDLAAEARAGRFRLDLYYRLSVFPIEVPPLRDRREDVGLLAEHFLRQAARRLGVSTPRLTRLNVQELQNYDWPGNVRELQNVIERTAILARGGRLQFDLPQRVTPARSAPLPATAATDEDEEHLSLDELVGREREIVLKALRRQNWKIYGPDGAAALLRVKPTTLASMMKRLRIEKERS